MNKLPKILLYGLSAIGIILLILTLIKSSQFDKGLIEMAELDASVGVLLSFLYITFIIGAILTVLAGIIGITTNPGGLKKSLVTIIAVVVSIVIGFVLSSDTVLPIHGDITSAMSKWSGVGLITFYSLFIMASGAIIYSAVGKVFK